MQGLPIQLFVALAGVFISVAVLAAVVASRLMSGRSPEQQRLRRVVRPSAATAGSPESLLARDPQAAKKRWVPRSVRDMSRLERRVTQAGYRSPSAATVFALSEYLLPAAIALAVLAWFGWNDRNGWVFAALGAIAGHLAPGFLLDHRIAERRKRIERGLPDVMDLLVVCLEAGSSLDQSIIKASRELEIAYPELTEELNLVTLETRAGKPRLEAFKNLAKRTGVDDVRALVGMLAQTDRFGTSVSQALRTLSESMRTKRQQIAEEKAAKLGVKLVFPLVLFLFPAFFVVVLGPAAITIMRALASTD
jgi:tight adherence protein C